MHTLFRPGHLIHTQEWEPLTQEDVKPLADAARVYTQAQAGTFKITTSGSGKGRVRANHFVEVRTCIDSGLLCNQPVTSSPHCNLFGGMV